MFLCQSWSDYEIIDAGGGNRLERWGNVVLLRPDPLAVWPMGQDNGTRVDAAYVRSGTGGGHWDFTRSLPESWQIKYKQLCFLVRPTGFKHTGLFPEQAVNWDWMQGFVAKADRPLRVLNLFAYTGGATIALAAAGANVVHVDAAKGMVAWARQNAQASGLEDRVIRYIVDDVMKFVLREVRRGRRYDAVVMDPPSYGRGPSGEMWKIERDLFALVYECSRLLSDNPLFFLINSYTTGLAPSALENVLRVALPQGNIEAGELGLPIRRGGLVMPCGACGRWWR